jgi:hypothetical protein
MREPSCSTRTDEHDEANSRFSQTGNAPQLINYQTTWRTTNFTRGTGLKTLIRADIGTCALYATSCLSLRWITLTELCRTDTQHITDAQEVRHAVGDFRRCETHTRVLWFCNDTLFSLECGCKMFCLLRDVLTALFKTITVQIATTTASYTVDNRLHIQTASYLRKL